MQAGVPSTLSMDGSLEVVTPHTQVRKQGRTIEVWARNYLLSWIGRREHAPGELRFGSGSPSLYDRLPRDRSRPLASQIGRKNPCSKRLNSCGEE